jgi:hypothetical protein
MIGRQAQASVRVMRLRKHMILDVRTYIPLSSITSRTGQPHRTPEPCGYGWLAGTLDCRARGAEDRRDGDVEHTKLVNGNTDGERMTMYRLSNLGLPTE